MKVKIKVPKSIKEKMQNSNMNTTKKFQKEKLSISNKISIADIITSAIAVLALIISVLSFETYHKQLNLDKINSRPTINIEATYTDDNNSIDELTISNEGAVASNIDIDIIPFYLICIYKEYEKEDGFSYDSNALLVPIEYNTFNMLSRGEDVLKTNYYNTKKGIICKSSISEFSQKYINELKEISECDKDVDTILNGFKISNIFIEYLINITYDDVLGNTCNELYYCVPNYAFNDFSNNKIKFSNNLKLEYVNEDSKFNAIYELLKDYQNSTEIGSYLVIGRTVDEKFGCFSQGITTAYNNQQFLN